MKKFGILAVITVFAAIVGFFTACEEVDYSDEVITFMSVEANGDENTTSTELYLSFNKAVEKFNIADITLSNISVSKVELSEPVTEGEKVRYTLTVNGLSAGGTVIVKVEKQGYNFKGSPLSTRLFFKVPVDFQGLSDNGISNLTTTQIFLTFDREIGNFSAADITLEGGPEGLIKGELNGPNGSGPVVYTLEVSGFRTSGQVMVTVSKAGFAFFPSSRPVLISFYTPPIVFMSVTADGNATTQSRLLTFAFDREISGLSADDFILDGISGIRKGAFIALGYDALSQSYKYTLAISEFTQSGTLNVSVSKTGFAINNSTRQVTVYHTISVTLLNVLANSGANGTTESITLVFNQPVEGLTASDIDLTPATIIKGEFTSIGNQYTLKISGFTSNVSLRVVVSKSGYTISNSTQNASIIYNAPVFDYVSDFRTWLSGMRTNTNTTAYKVTLTVASDNNSPLPDLTIRQVLTSAIASGKYVEITLDVGDTNTTLEVDSFKGCVTLVTIDLQGPITLGNTVFSGCTYLTTVTIGEEVSITGKSVFTGCSRLSKIEVHEKNNNLSTKDDVLYNSAGTTLKAYPAAKRGDEFIIPSIPSGVSVTSIEEEAFSGCTNLDYITIPDTVTTIEKYAFKNCTGLREITIPYNDSLTIIDEGVFSGCTRLAKVTIAGAGDATDFGAITSIEKSAFSGCTSLTTVDFAKGDVFITIGEAAFKGCNKLASITLPDSIETISKEAFSGCTVLNNVAIPESVTTIEEGAFSDCSGLRVITLVDNDTNNITIGDKAFANSGLTSATLPASVTTFGKEVFSGCTGLTTITINGAISIDGDTLKGCSGLTTLAIGQSVNIIAAGALSGCAKLATLTVNVANTTYSAASNVLYTKDGSSLLAYPPARAGSFTIPADVTTIGDSAFKNCTSSGFSSINIPVTVENITGNPFAGCTSLTSITVGASGLTTSPYYYAENGVLYDAAKETLIAYPAGKTGTAFVIPSSAAVGGVKVTTIAVGAFYGAVNITDVEIPTTVGNIAADAFTGCSKLVKVDFKGQIQSTNFNASAFPGDLRSKFYASINALGTPGVYTRPNGTSTTWTKQ
jgi:hypothetical protein